METEYKFKKPVPPNFCDFTIKLRSLSSPYIIKRYIFLFGCYWQYSLIEVDQKFELKLSKSQICLYCKRKSKENRFRTKKSTEKGIFDYQPKK